MSLTLDLSCAGLGGGGRKRGAVLLTAGFEKEELIFWSPGTPTEGGATCLGGGSGVLTGFPTEKLGIGPGGLVNGAAIFGGGCLGN